MIKFGVQWVAKKASLAEFLMYDRKIEGNMYKHTIHYL